MIITDVETLNKYPYTTTPLEYFGRLENYGFDASQLLGGRARYIAKVKNETDVFILVNPDITTTVGIIHIDKKEFQKILKEWKEKANK